MLCVQLRDLKPKDSIEFESIVLATTFSWLFKKPFLMTNIYVFHLNFSDLSLDSLEFSCTFVGGRTRVSLMESVVHLKILGRLLTILATLLAAKWQDSVNLITVHKSHLLIRNRQHIKREEKIGLTFSHNKSLPDFVRWSSFLYCFYTFKFGFYPFYNCIKSPIHGPCLSGSKTFTCLRENSDLSCCPFFNYGSMRALKISPCLENCLTGVVVRKFTYYRSRFIPTCELLTTQSMWYIYVLIFTSIFSFVLNSSSKIWSVLSSGGGMFGGISAFHFTFSRFVSILLKRVAQFWCQQ